MWTRQSRERSVTEHSDPTGLGFPMGRQLFVGPLCMADYFKTPRKPSHSTPAWSALEQLQAQHRKKRRTQMQKQESRMNRKTRIGGPEPLTCFGGETVRKVD